MRATGSCSPTSSHKDGWRYETVVAEVEESNPAIVIPKKSRLATSKADGTRNLAMPSSRRT